MSRIGKKPVLIPAQVEVTLSGAEVTVKGPKGTLTRTLSPQVTVEIRDVEGGRHLLISPVGEDAAAIWGTTRALLTNMVTGVVSGFTRALEVIGVGYKANVQGKKLIVSAGYSHDVPVDLPEGVSATVEKNVITLSGIDKEAVGKLASYIRSIRKPEPYKGKGIKYVEEHIRRKAGKAAKTSE